jgi:peptidoglycan DL-endopeptidase CwlO
MIDTSRSDISSDSTRPLGPTRRVRRAIVAGLIATTAFAAVAVDTGVAAAEALPTNALAPAVTASAAAALAAYNTYVVTGSPGALQQYTLNRSKTAALAARELGYSEPEMVEAWSSAPLDHQQAVLAAMTQVGVPYRSNTSEPGVGFDCSGLTTYAWARAGVTLARQSGSQISAAARVERDTAIAGDLVQYPGHVMMYLGVGDAIIHSVQTGRTVEIDTISTRKSGSVRFGDPAP